jgi:hypothetical protein
MKFILFLEAVLVRPFEQTFLISEVNVMLCNNPVELKKEVSRHSQRKMHDSFHPLK